MALTQIPSGMIAPAQTLSLNGVTFPATQSASADANTLDDYEEGTWTATDNSGAGLSLSSAFTGYVKVGRQVTVCGQVGWPVTSNTATISVGGLPFTSNSTMRFGVSVYTGQGNPASILLLSNVNSFLLRNNSGDAYTNANYSNNSFIFIFSYFV
jgi:hypothetical protein